MKIAIVPFSAVVVAGRLDAEFYCDPGGADRKRAEKLRLRAAKLLQDAQDAELAAVAEESTSRALGIVVVGDKS